MEVQVRGGISFSSQSGSALGDYFYHKEQFFDFKGKG
jgi:hypothetical protein